MEENKEVTAVESSEEVKEETPVTENSSETSEETPVSEEVKEDIKEDVTPDEAPEVTETALVSLPEKENTEISEETPKKKKTRKEKNREKLEKVLTYKPGNDIKFRGPIGIRGLRIIGWILVILSTFTISISLLMMMGLVSATDVGINAAYILCSYCGSVAIPCFMLARFAMIFQKKKSFKGMLFAYGSIALLIIAIFMLIYFHYAIEILEVVADKTYTEAKTVMEGFVHKIATKKLSFNVFLDMFLWSWYFAAIEYEIKKKNIWKIILQKVIAFVPFAYVLFWFVIKILFAFNQMDINGVFLPFIPTTTPIIFLAFISISGFIKRRKTLYLKIGGTEEGYKDYLKTNANSLHFSKVTALSFLFAGIMEFVFLLIFLIIVELKAGTLDSESVANVIKITGTNSCFSYMLFAPCILLFSYTRLYKNDKIDMLVPIIAIILIVFILIEVGYISLITWCKYFRAMS